MEGLHHSTMGEWVALEPMEMVLMTLLAKKREPEEVVEEGRQDS